MNGKIFITTYPNLKNQWLNMGRYMNSQLQKDWNEMGRDAFTYEVLEQKEVKDVIDKRFELKQMEKP